MSPTLRALLGLLLGGLATALDALRRPKPLSAYAASIVFMFLMFHLGEATKSGLVALVWMTAAIPVFWIWTALVRLKQDRRPSGLPD